MPADHEKSVSDYRAVSAGYDRRTRLTDAVRLEAVAALGLQPGDTVLDAACGTGFCLPPILERIGERGRLMAFDSSPELLSQARARIGNRPNVLLIEAFAENVDLIQGKPGAILFSYTHDLLQSNAALDNLLGQAAPGARIAACGSVLWPWWGWPLSFPVNLWLRARHRRYITNMEDFDRPWAKLESRLADFRVSRRGPGWRYLASGRLRA
ncbi:MAG TPA: methyltransferase domain-containing protein [Burkholderiales bacterium]|jgi:demethylmenaquinone methyltransferase/2-methoxy-6-polyprenyl-1,4-benzoquinol methylase|nr:methyltransferase domain-containing protein [Burkholderiales bacterium]